MTQTTSDPQSLHTVLELHDAAALHLDPMIPGGFDRHRSSSAPKASEPEFVPPVIPDSPEPSLNDRARLEHEWEGGGAPSSRSGLPASWLMTWLRRD